MEAHSVFSSSITREQKSLSNNLHDLINIIPAKPVQRKLSDSFWHFEPQIGKIYIPKKRHKLKVKTIGDIRSQFEKDTYIDLPNQLKIQKNILLRKIREGSSKNESTKILARSILNNTSPVSRSAWQMLMQLNPEEQTHISQYLLWNGKKILINGSRGGATKLICNCDLGKQRSVGSKKKISLTKKKPVMLQNSVSVQFKPGPLTKKKDLDISYQKYSIGYIELTELPNIGLHIEPTFDIALDPTITYFLNKCRDVDGKISETWAEFAVSVLGTLNDAKAIQINKKPDVTFRLDYKCNQRRILMRREFSKSFLHSGEGLLSETIVNPCIADTEILPEVKNIMEEILDSIEISLNQDNMYTGEDDPRDVCLTDSNSTQLNFITHKSKKRYSELEKLDVTVIDLDDESQSVDIKKCGKLYCSFGCICASLSFKHRFKGHCGRIQCMFECKCKISKYEAYNLSKEEQDSELISGWINIQKDKKIKLSKEEKRFHQTVIFTADKSILLKAQKRNSVVSRKYADFYSDFGLKKENNEKKILAIPLLQLNCSNVEPWCMTHNLYKCFCRGRFVKKTDCDFSDEEKVLPLRKTSEIPVDQEKNISVQTEPNSKSVKIHSMSERILPVRKTSEILVDQEIKLATQIKPNSNSVKIHLTSESSDYSDLLPIYDNNTCARMSPYSGRKYNNAYYFQMNKKIFEMEKNDLRLHERMMKCVNKYSERVVNNANIHKLNIEKQKHDLEKKDLRTHKRFKECLSKFSKKDMNNTNIVKLNKNVDVDGIPINIVQNPNNKDDINSQSQIKLSQNETEISSWLETSYQEYKKRFAHNSKLSLDPPTIGKLALYPWEFIASRFTQKKNLFLISQQPRHRIFMAVDSKHPFFANCINIYEISFNDLNKYPIIVKNLLTRKVTDLKGHFCILRGLVNCWELIGSVSKLNNQEESIRNPKDVSNTESNKYCVLPVSSIDTDLFQSPNNINVNKSVSPVISNSEDLNIQFDTHSTNSVILPESDLNTLNIVNCDIQDLLILPESIDETHAVSADNRSKAFGNNGTNASVSLAGTDDSVFINKSPDTLAELANSIITAKNIDTETIVQTDAGYPESSKWFFMIVRNDFSEIKFHNKGFFVKLDSIVQAIYVARKTGKTVRLSSQTCISNSREPQFGVYALPTAKFCSVFIGPYEKHESLGIESVKTLSDIRRQNKTVGCWFTTDKVENMKVIENPYHFMQRINTEMMILDSISHLETTVDDKLKDDSKEPEKLPENLMKEQSTKELKAAHEHPKTVKPIKIKKTSEIYHLVPSSLLFNKSSNVNIPTLRAPVMLKNAITQKPDTYSLPSTVKSCENRSAPTQKPVAQIAPQPKLPNSSPKISICPTKQGMFILNPEEINSRLNGNTSMSVRVDCTLKKTDAHLSHKQIDKDIENFLASSKVCQAPDDSILIDSDDEDHSSTKSECMQVYIQCKNVEKLGWIKGKIDRHKRLSFEFPGFKFTDFYSEKEAFFKINQVLSRKVYVPKHIVLEWEIVENLENLKNKHMLSKKDMGPTIVMTKTGLRRKQDLTPTEYSVLMKSVDSQNDNLQISCQSNDAEQNTEETIDNTSTVILSVPKTVCKASSFDGKTINIKNVKSINKADIKLACDETSDYFPSSDEEEFRGYETISVEPTNVASTCDQSKVDTRPPCTIVATYSLSEETTSAEKNLDPKKDIAKASASFKEQSQILEDVGSLLLNETVLKKNEILFRLNSVTKDQRQVMTNKLQNIMAENVP